VKYLNTTILEGGCTTIKSRIRNMKSINYSTNIKQKNNECK
jgi:hypothetical protein